MRLLAISDLHVGHETNFRALESITAQPGDWLMLGGDIVEKTDDLKKALAILKTRFKQLVWIPGNHELWTLPHVSGDARGESKYLEMVNVCRDFGVSTPEDPYPIFENETGRFRIVPMFLLYDYTFRPDDVRAEDALQWAMEHGVVCADEHVLHPDPYRSREEWCAARCESTYARLKELPQEEKLILLNHFPLRYDTARLPLIPRFSLWCGTRRTESWHREFNVEAVVYGHLHIPARQYRDGVRFEEVSLGYPRQWRTELGIDHRIRVIVPETRSEDGT